MYNINYIEGSEGEFKEQQHIIHYHSQKKRNKKQNKTKRNNTKLKYKK